MGLTWVSQPVVSLSLGYRADGVQVGRVRRWRNGWEGHYDPDGLDRPPAEPMGAPADPGHLVGRWASAGEAQQAVDRHHDRHATS